MQLFADIIKAGNRFTLTVERDQNGKIKVTSLSWDEAPMC
jgi:hypothetical protein